MSPHPRQEYFRKRSEACADPVAMGDWTSDDAEPRVLHEAYAAYRAGIWEALEPAPGMRCLDAGCGAGASLLGLEGRGLELFGFDFCAGMLAQARRFVRGPRWALGEVQRIPFRSGAFDRVLASGVLQYLTQREARLALAELCRVCRAGGIVYVSNLQLGVPTEDVPEYGPHIRLSTFFDPGFVAEALPGMHVEMRRCALQGSFPHLRVADARIRVPS